MAAAVLLVLVSVQAGFAAEQKAQFKVPGVVGPSTAGEASSALKKIDGVKDVGANFETHILTVSFDAGKTNVDALKKALEKAGFPVEGKSEAMQ